MRDVVLISPLSDSLIRVLSRPPIGRRIHELWRRLVADEIRRCARSVDTIMPRERSNACKLLDWYISTYLDVPESWLVLYPPREKNARVHVATIDWAAAHADELSLEDRWLVDEMIQMSVDELGVYHSWWSSIRV